MSGNLPLPAPDIQALGRAALDFIATYYDSLADRRVIHSTTSAALRNLLTEPLPQSRAAFESLLETMRAIAEFSRHNGHPRFFGYVSSPGTPVAALGSMIESALNINVTCWRSG